MSAPRILLLDRPGRSSQGLSSALEREGYVVDRPEDRGSALALIREGECELVLGELDEGEDLLREALSLPHGPPVVLFDDFASLSETVEALRRGAFDTIARPATDEKVLLTVRRALGQRRLEDENRRLREAVRERFELGQMISRDPRMRRVFELAEAVADSRATLLLQGESGTGKSLLARAIHGRQASPEAPFVVVNCGALPGPLLESELFGHARGAFTGAVREHRGKFEVADGGTIFLDEIGTASPELQVKLLRVLEEGCFERVGESETRSVDVRVIAATNCDLEEEVAARRFRSDLFYRIRVVAIELPPLRERMADVPLLAELFIARFVRVHGRDLQGLEPAAVSRLMSHSWPGNVRELENAVERAVLLAPGPRIRVVDLFGDPRPRRLLRDEAEEGTPRLEDLPLGPLKEVLEVPERWLIVRALQATDGRRQEAARLLGINRTTLFNKMRKYDLLSLPGFDATLGEANAS